MESLSEQEILDRFSHEQTLLNPLLITNVATQVKRGRRLIDARIEAKLPDGDSFSFVAEIKSRSTLDAIHAATTQAREAAHPDELALIIVPYLSQKRLEQLCHEKMNGVDLCGNGVINVPHRLYIFRTGQPNQYPDSRAINNPFSGRSSFVARALLTRSKWDSLSAMVSWIGSKGGQVSLPQASKAAKVLEEDMLIAKHGNEIQLRDPGRLLDKLGRAWKPPKIKSRIAVRTKDVEWPSRLSSVKSLDWALTGESSASRYVAFTQGGPRQIAVSNVSAAALQLNGSPERIRNFADLELIETQEPAYYFQTETDSSGMRWASRLQTWIELQAGDGRQQDAANELKLKVLDDCRHGPA